VAVEVIMINNAKISYEIPDVSVTPTVEVTEIHIGPNEVVRGDLALETNLPCRVTTSNEVRNNIASKLAKVTRRYVSTNATLQTETPYEVSAHIVLRADQRYATTEQKLEVVGALISFLMEKADGSDRNVVRLAKGEL
jgi:hypothetical protein